MIIYCDTSALMKVYALEQYSDWTLKQVASARPCTVSQVTWVEMCAALALKGRTNQITSAQVTSAMHRLKTEWGGYTQLAIDNALIATAGELALAFGLRAYDSLQLASAARVHHYSSEAMSLCCFDRQLNAAAVALGIHTLNPGST